MFAVTTFLLKELLTLYGAAHKKWNILYADRAIGQFLKWLALTVAAKGGHVLSIP